MAARNRPPRANLAKEDLADEVQLWHSIVDKIRRCGALHKQYEDAATEIVTTEDKLLEDDDFSNLPHLETLSRLNREGLKFADEELKILVEEPDALISNLETLISVRAAFEDIPATATGSRSGVDRSSTGSNTGAASGGTGTVAVVIGGNGGPGGPKRNLKRRLETDVGPGSAIDSPGMTPEPMSATVATGGGRIVGKAGSRSGSVGVGASKSEAGSDSMDGSKVAQHEKYMHIKVGTQVLLKHNNKKSDGEGILGSVISMHGEGKMRRYEIQDPEPDETGQLPPSQKAFLNLLEIIPPPSATATLPDLVKGKQVIALYPDTSTFYKAEGVGKRGDVVRLRFEGEDETDKELEVERRLVLDVKA